MKIDICSLKICELFAANKSMLSFKSSFNHFNYKNNPNYIFNLLELNMKIILKNMRI